MGIRRRSDVFSALCERPSVRGLGESRELPGKAAGSESVGTPPRSALTTSRQQALALRLLPSCSAGRRGVQGDRTPRERGARSVAWGDSVPGPRLRPVNYSRIAHGVVRGVSPRGRRVQGQTPESQGKGLWRAREAPAQPSGRRPSTGAWGVDPVYSNPERIQTDTSRQNQPNPMKE